MSRFSFDDAAALAAADVLDIWTVTGGPVRTWTLRQCLEWAAGEGRRDIWLFRPGAEQALWVEPGRVVALMDLLGVRRSLGTMRASGA